MTTLTHTGRTILRSRIRRHPNNANVLNGQPVSDMSNADLVQAGLLLGLGVPSDAECQAYVEAKAIGASGRRAISAADTVRASESSARAGTAGTAASVMLNDTDDADDKDDTDDTDDATDLLTPSNAAPASVSSGDGKSEKDVADLLARMGSGDFAGFQSGLKALAARANRPDPAPVVKEVRIEVEVPAVDTSKLSGHVAKVTGKKSVKALAIADPAFASVADVATAMDVYDAPDAPKVDPDYLWPAATPAILSQMARGRTVFLTGPAGTGKTSFAKQVAANWQRPFVRISCDDQTEASTLVGMTVPDGASGVKWQDGQLAAAIRRPGTVILIDEPSVARPGALFVLQAVLDDDRRLHVAETGEVIQVARGVVFILADNTNGTGDTTGAYESTRRLNRAFLDRASITVQLDYLTVDLEAKALMAKTGCTAKIAAALAKFAATTRAKADGGHVSHGIGVRRLFALAELLADGVQQDRAFQMAVIETTTPDDREPLRQIWTAEINAKSLNQEAGQ